MNHLAQQRRDDQAQDQAGHRADQLVQRHLVNLPLHLAGQPGKPHQDPRAEYQHDQAADQAHARITGHGNPGLDARGRIGQLEQLEHQLEYRQADADAHQHQQDTEQPLQSL